MTVYIFSNGQISESEDMNLGTRKRPYSLTGSPVMVIHPDWVQDTKEKELEDNEKDKENRAA